MIKIGVKVVTQDKIVRAGRSEITKNHVLLSVQKACTAENVTLFEGLLTLKLPSAR